MEYSRNIPELLATVGVRSAVVDIGVAVLTAGVVTMWVALVVVVPTSPQQFHKINARVGCHSTRKVVGICGIFLEYSIGFSVVS